MSRECDSPQFCFTGDLDWAPEPMVARHVALIDQDHNRLGHIMRYVLEAMK